VKQVARRKSDRTAAAVDNCQLITMHREWNSDTINHSTTSFNDCFDFARRFCASAHRLGRSKSRVNEKLRGKMENGKKRDDSRIIRETDNEKLRAERDLSASGPISEY